MRTLDETRRIFCEAIEKQTQQEREAYLDEACCDNPSLRAEIDALLEAHGANSAEVHAYIYKAPKEAREELERARLEAMEEELRFAIREGSRTIGAGVVSEIIE